MATGGEQLAGEQTPLRNAAEAEQGADADLAAPSGWTKKLNPTRGGRFEVVFVAPTGEEIKSKRSLTLYLKAHPGGPASSEFVWATGNTPRRSSRLSEKVKATESPEDEKPAKRGRSSSSKKGKKGKQEDAEEAPAESGDHVDAEEAQGTDVEMKDADNAQEEKKEPDTAQEEKKDVPMVDSAEKTEEAEGKTEGSVLSGVADAAEKTEEAEVNTEVSEIPKVADAAEKTEEAKGNVEVSVLPGDVSAPVSEEVAPLEGEKTENGPVTESTGLHAASSVEKKEEADSTINPPTPPPVEINPDTPAAEAAKAAENSTDAPAAEAAKAAENSTDAPAAEAAKAAENSADNAAHKDEQVNVDSNGQIQPGASTVKCT